jgi:hypothetical protein
LRLLQLHVFASGSPLAVNPDAIAQIEDYKGHANIKRFDGGSVEVRETFEEVLVMLGRHPTDLGIGGINNG